jgi:uracil-DNA glycosylase
MPTGPFCHDCPHAPLGIRFIPPDGAGTSGVLLVGDSPWIDEIREGRPFVGAAGSTLNRMFQLIGMDRADTMITNTIWCFPGDAFVEAQGIKKVYRRLFEGEAIRVETLIGHIEGTPNHPVLTQRGWVPLGQLDDSDYLVHGRFDQGLAARNPYPQCRPTTFEQLFSAFDSPRIYKRAVGSVVDFHGDGMDSEVDVVTLKGELGDGGDSSLIEKLVQGALKCADHLARRGKRTSAGFHDLLDAFRWNMRASYSGVGLRDCFPDTFRTHHFHPSRGPFVGISGLDSETPQRLMGFDYSNMEDSTELGKGFPANISFNKVCRISKFKFCGHVYNLETSSGRYITNGFVVSNCKPLRLNWMDHPQRYADANAAIEHCRPNLDSLIERMPPKVIVPLGNVALRRVCGVSGIERHAGYVLATPYGVPAVPGYHPSFVQQGNQKLNASCMFVLNRAREIANGTYKPSQYELLLDPPPDDLRAYIRRSCVSGRIPTLIVDIETPESDRIDEEEIEQEGPSWIIVRAGFSAIKGTAVSFPWTEPYITILQEALDLADEMIEHADAHFDSRRLRHAGLRLPRRIVSSLWCWHWLESDLRKGLGMVAPFFYAGPPWKHESQSRPAYYNAMDNAVTMDVYLGCRDILVKTGRWDGFEKHIIQMDEPYTVMGSRGLDVDPVAQKSFMERLELEWDSANERLQLAVPDSLKKVKRWKRAPRDMTGVRVIDTQVSS